MKKLLLAAAYIISFATNAQFGALKKLKDKVAGELPVSSLLEGKSPITTNFKDDVKMESALSDTNGSKAVYADLTQLERNEEGGFVVKPGFYEMTNRSYCLKAGTYGPSSGDGYMYAPIVGPEHEAVTAILRNTVLKPEIPQHDVQLLLWAIIAKAKFESMQGRTKAVASMLLTPVQIASLNRNALGIVSDLALKNGSSSLPPIVQQVLEAENKMRQMFSTGAGTFEDFERIAVLAGMAPAEDHGVHKGMWSKHPDGYYVRYFPYGYSTTKVQLWVPQVVAPGTIYDPALQIACPANTGAQRLAQSAVAKQL